MVKPTGKIPGSNEMKTTMKKTKILTLADAVKEGVKGLSREVESYGIRLTPGQKEALTEFEKSLKRDIFKHPRDYKLT